MTPVIQIRMLRFVEATEQFSLGTRNGTRLGDFNICIKADAAPITPDGTARACWNAEWIFYRSIATNDWQFRDMDNIPVTRTFRELGL